MRARHYGSGKTRSRSPMRSLPLRNIRYGFTEAVPNLLTMVSFLLLGWSLLSYRFRMVGKIPWHRNLHQCVRFPSGDSIRDQARIGTTRLQLRTNRSVMRPLDVRWSYVSTPSNWSRGRTRTTSRGRTNESAGSTVSTPLQELAQERIAYRSRTRKSLFLDQ